MVAGVAVLVSQLILGLSDDVVNGQGEHPIDAGVPGKPVAEGRIPAGNVSFIISCLVLVLIPVTLLNGATAGAALAGTVLIGWISIKWLHRTWLSWLPWAASFALYPAFLSYGGWGGAYQGDPPTWAITGLAAAFGVCLHFLTSLPDLVIDNRNRLRHLPLRIALHTGAPRLFAVSILATVAVGAGIVLTALDSGLSQ